MDLFALGAAIAPSNARSSSSAIGWFGAQTNRIEPRGHRIDDGWALGGRA